MANNYWVQNGNNYINILKECVSICDASDFDLFLNRIPVGAWSIGEAFL